jgi:hypothetical protein
MSYIINPWARMRILALAELPLMPLIVAEKTEEKEATI